MIDKIMLMSIYFNNINVSEIKNIINSLIFFVFELM